MAKKIKSKTKKGGYTPSAWNYVMSTIGDGATQAQNSLVLQPGESIPASKSLDIEPINNPNAQFGQPYLPPNMKGGGKKRGSRTMKKGGSWMGTLNTALVPFSIWGLQYFSKKSTGSRKRKQSKNAKTKKK